MGLACHCTLCADINGLSLRAAVRWGAEDRHALKPRRRCITRAALANKRVRASATGQAAGSAQHVLAD